MRVPSSATAQSRRSTYSLAAVAAQDRLFTKQRALAGGEVPSLKIKVVDPHRGENDVAPTLRRGASQFGLPPRPQAMSSESKVISSGVP